MIIVNKLIEIANNEPKVYTAGMFNLANSAEESWIGSASGNNIVITDISSVEHLVKTRVETAIDILNDDNKSFEDKRTVESFGVYAEWVEENEEKTNRIHVHTSVATSSIQTSIILFSLKLGAGTYRFDADMQDLKVATINRSYESYWSIQQTGKPFTITEEVECQVAIEVHTFTDKETDIYGTPKLFQLIEFQPVPITVADENGISTEYMPNEDGIVEGVKSIYPTMTITTPAENAIIYADYVKDIPKETQRISSNAHNRGYAEGHSDGLAVSYDKGFEAGKKAEYDRFWDSFQKNGNRRAYRNSFGNGWTDELFKPKYPFGDISDGYMMFAASGIKDIPNLKIVGSSQYCFFNNKTIEHLKEIAVNDDMYGTFSGCSSLVTIDKLIMNYANTSGKTYTSSFNGCSALENIVIEGEIKGNISFQYSPKLSKDSIISVINALYSTASSKTLTLSRTAVDEAFKITESETDDSGNSTSVTVMGSSSEEWSTLIATKTNWTISLV